MFNEAWIRFAVLIVFFGVLMQSHALIVLAVMLLTVIPLSWAWNRVSLWRVSYERSLSEHRVFVGETVELSVALSNRKLLPLAWTQVDDQFPSVLAPSNKPLSPSHIPMTSYLTLYAALGGYERARWRFNLPCQQRGFFSLGPARLKSGDLFGLFERAWTSPRTERLIVYPRIQSVEDWGLPPKDPLGDVAALARLYDDPARPRGVRDYHPEDAPKHIHWRATARTGELQVKLYDPTITYQWVLFVNVATFRHAWQGVDSELLERLISLAASIAYYGAEHKYAVGLIANGSWPESDQRLKILPGRNPEQLRHILEALAAVTYFTTANLETLLRNESPKLPWGATLVVITGVVSEELLAEMLRLRRVGRRLALLSLDENWAPPDNLKGIILRQVIRQK